MFIAHTVPKYSWGKPRGILDSCGSMGLRMPRNRTLFPALWLLSGESRWPALWYHRGAEPQEGPQGTPRATSLPTS